MRCAVTGGCGFIGTHLVQALLRYGHSVLVVDRRISRLMNQLSSEHPGRVMTLQEDISKAGVMWELFDSVDIIFHLAAQVDVQKSIQDPVSALHDDLLSTVRILKAAASHSPPIRIVLASSAAVYGACGGELEEGYARLVTPSSPYGIHKRSCEMYAEMYRTLHQLDTVCLRYFNVYGPGQLNTQAVVPSFLLGAMRDGVVRVTGDGTQTRDFIHVQDVVEATLKAGFSSFSGLNQVFNVGTGKPHSLLKLIDLIREVTNLHIRIEYVSSAPGDIPHSYASLDRVKTLGWSPRVSLLEGLRDTVSYYRKMV